MIKKKIQQSLTHLNVAPGVYGWMKGICKDDAFTVRVTHLTLTEGKFSEAVCVFLFLLVTQTHRKFSTGLQEPVKPWLDFGIGNSTHTATGPSPGLSGGRRRMGRGVAGTGQDTSETETQAQHSLKLHIR